MPTLKVPAPLRSYTGGKNEVPVRGATVGEAISDLVDSYPSLKPHLFNGSGDLRPFVNLFLADENVKDLQGMDTPLQEGDRLMLIPSIAGGSRYSDVA